MIDDIFVYCVDLPDGIAEMVTPCLDGYTVYIDAGLDSQHRRRAYKHALEHIKRRDFETPESVQIKEGKAHGL